MDEDRKKAIDDLVARNPKLDNLVTKLLNSKEADSLFQKMREDEQQAEQKD